MEPDLGATVELEDGAIRLEFPAGAVEESTTLVVAVVPAESLPSGLDLDSVISAVSVSGVAALQVPVALSFELVGTGLPMTMWQVVHFHNGAWTRMPTVVEGGRAVAGAMSFSEFALIAEIPRSFEERRVVAGFTREDNGLAFPNAPSMLNALVGDYPSFDGLNGLCLGMVHAARDFFAAGMLPPVKRPVGRGAVGGGDAFGVSSDAFAEYVKARQSQGVFEKLVAAIDRLRDGPRATSVMDAAEAVFSELGIGPVPFALWDGDGVHAVLGFEATKVYNADADLLAYVFEVYDPNGYEYRLDDGSADKHRFYPALVVVNVWGYLSAQLAGGHPDVELLYHSFSELTPVGSQRIGVPTEGTEYRRITPNPYGREVNTSGLPWSNPTLVALEAVVEGAGVRLSADGVHSSPGASIEFAHWEVWEAGEFELGYVGGVPRQMWRTNTQVVQSGDLAPGDYVAIATLEDGQGNYSNTLFAEFVVEPSPGEPEPVVVSIDPSSVTMPVYSMQSFTATVTGASDTSVSWSASCGSIGGSGNTVTYTAPATATSCAVTATSVADSAKSATASVTVTGGDSGFDPAPSYITIENVTLGAASGGTRLVGFDISWDESWRGPSRPSWVEASDNWDAAWVFVKYRVSGGAWQHATLVGSGHVVPSGAVVDVPSDRVGAFVYRSSSGYGTFTANGVGLQWDYVADGVSVGASVEVRPFGIEMVYVPEGSFSVGSGGSGAGEFFVGGTSNAPFVVSSQASIALGDAAGQLNWTLSANAGSPSGSTNASFPTGYGAFYVMKYQVTQGQYVGFLNTLTQAQADVRKYTGSSYRYAITGSSMGSYATSLPFVALNYVSWADGVAFSDWAGLRPMTELEFEKAARGPLSPVTNEYAWGSTSITPATGLVNAGTISETPTPTDANVNHDWGIQGPVRVGLFAAPGRSRRDAGAGFYGALELSGNLWERPVTVGNAEGRAFTGAHGNGTLGGSGNANVSSWPGSTAVGAGFRGGFWFDPHELDDYLLVSSRTHAAGTSASRGYVSGWRGARSAP